MATKSTPFWRDILKIHAAAELFPRMSPDELQTLGEDIIKHGLTSPVVLWRAHPKGEAVLLDGRNRLDAIELVTGSPVEFGAPSLMAGKFLATDKVIVLDKSVEPYAYVTSVNLHRRNLTTEQKHDVIAKLLKAMPDKSDRQIAKMAKVSPTTVGTERHELEASGTCPVLDTRTDARNRQQPARKPRKDTGRIPQIKENGPPPPEESSAEEEAEFLLQFLEGLDPAEQRYFVRHLPPEMLAHRDDIGAASRGELERKDARIVELETHVRCLEQAKAALERENSALRALLPPGDAGPIIACCRHEATS